MLYINGRFRTAQITGVQRYATEVVNRLPLECTIVGPDRQLSSLRGHAWEQLILPTLLSDGDFLWSPANTSCMFLKRQVVTIHDASVLDHPEWFSKDFSFIYKTLWSNISKNAEYIITDSEFSEKRLRSFFPRLDHKIINIPLGVGDEFRSTSDIASQDVRHKFLIEGSYVLTLGSLEPRKNLKSLFSAWSQWMGRPRGLKLIVVGGAGKSFSGMGFDEVPNGVVLLGRVPDPDLPGLYAGASAFVFPSLYEGFGLPPLEAMAAGAPVICSHTTSLPEVMGTACLYIDPLKPETILESLKRLMADGTLRAELSSAGKERSAIFTWEKTAEMTAQVLSDVMA